MPRDYRVGLDENECFGPVGPDPTNDHPERAIEPISIGVMIAALFATLAYVRAFLMARHRLAM